MPLCFTPEPLETALLCKFLNCRAWLRLKWAHWQWASKMPDRGQFADLAISLWITKHSKHLKALNSLGQCPCENFDAAGHSHPSTQIPSAPLKKCRTFVESTFLLNSRCRVSVKWHPNGLSFSQRGSCHPSILAVHAVH